MKTSDSPKTPRNTIPAIAAFYCTILACSITQAATITWTNTAGGWNTATDWSPNSVPGATDTAVIPTGSVSLNSATTVGGIILGTNGPGGAVLSLNGNTLSLNGPLTVKPSGTFTVDSGTLVGNTNATLSGTIGWTGGLFGGTLTLAGGSTLDLTTANNHDMPNCVFTNNGTVTWNNGTIRSGGSGGTFIYNFGLWDAQSDQQLTTAAYDGSTVFNNLGTLRKSGGTNTSQTTLTGSVLYNQPSGVLDVQQGNLSLQGSGNFNGGYITTNATGTTTFAAGNFNLNGTATGTNVFENAGNLVGNNVINGALEWVAGTWNNITMAIPANSAVTIIGGTGNNDMASTTLTNQGTIQWVSGTIRSGGSSGTFIYNYGLWNAQSDEQLTTSGYDGATVFNNYGTFRKSGGTNTSQTLFSSGVQLNQIAGAVDVQQGDLTLQGTGNFTGGTANNPAGTINLSQGNYTINGTAITNFIQTAADLTGVNVINGGLTWIGGVWNSITLTIQTNSLVVVAGGTGNNDMANTILTNYGTVRWTSGNIRNGGSSGTFVYNYGLWDVQSDLQFTVSGYDGATIFNNYGTFRKELTTGATTFSTGTTFNSPGQLNILTGTLVFDGPANFPTGTLNIQAADLQLGGGGTLDGVALANEAGIIYLTGGSFNINGTVLGTNIIENGGNLVGTNLINGAITWISGNWNTAVVTTTTNTTVTITNRNFTHDMANCIFTNYGTVVWNSGDIRSGGSSGTLLYNYGTWDAQSDQTISTAAYDGDALFNNYGIFRKSGGASEFSTATTFASPIAFNQLAGVIDVQDGTNGLQLSLQSGGNFNGGYITTNQYGLTSLAAGNFNLNGTVTGTNTWENGGDLVGTTLINSALTWVSGNWNSAPTVTLPTNATLIIISENDHDMANCIVTNNGTVTWNSGDIRSGGSSGTFIYNFGLWNAQDDQQLTTAAYDGSTVFNNYGTFRKSGGANTNQTLLASAVFYNQPSGALDIQQGNFILQGGADFNGGYITTNATGTTTFAAGNFNLNGTATGTNVFENAGNLVGNNVINGALQWIAGTWNSITMTILANSTVTIAGGTGNNDMASTTLTNQGTIQWQNGTIRSGGSSGTLIYNYGLWNAKSDEQLTTAAYDGTTVFDNFGTFRKSGGTNTIFAAGIELNQLAGAIDIQQGAVTVQGTGNFTGGTANDPAGTIYLTEGTDNINGTKTANMVQNTANLTGTNVINGNFTWIAGTWNSITMTILADSTVTIAGGTGNDDMANAIITNNGNVFWNSGTIRSGGSGGTAVYNSGLWEAESDQIFTTASYDGSATFNNSGTFLKEFSTGTTAFQAGAGFANTGTMNVQSGTISLQGAYALANGTRMDFGLNGTGNNGQITLSGPASFTGSVSANFNNPFYWPTVGTTFPLLNYTSESGTLFPNTNLPAFISWQTNYTPTAFTITVMARSTNPAPSKIFYTKTSQTNLFLEWYGDHTGWTLESQTNTLAIGLSNNWTPIAGSGLTNQLITSITSTNPTVFYRMIYP